jgi:anti-sigma regulatory factor (Ser/Thr protein kinase)
VTEQRQRDRWLREAAERQRRFLREMLAGMTEGRLRLCDTQSDLPALLPPAGEPVALSKPTLRLLRKQVEAVAEVLKIPKERGHDLVTAVGEAAMNAVVHAGGGTGRVYADTAAGTIQVWVRDQGVGIQEESLHRATLEKGFSTGGSLGHGFFLMLQTCDRVHLLTGTGGTTVVLEQERNAPEPGWLKSM